LTGKFKFIEGIKWTLYGKLLIVCGKSGNIENYANIFWC
jgi:hypothetical protein